MQAFHYDSIDSTQTQARRLIDDAQIINEAFIVAKTQTAGRGHYGKCWASPAGAGIYLSLVSDELKARSSKLKAQSSMLNGLDEFVSSYTVEVAKKLIATLNTIYAADYYVKPINDVYYNGAKLAGILVEIYKGYVITGIGINLRDVPRTIKESIVDQPKAPPISLEEIFPENIFQGFDQAAFIEDLVLNLNLTSI